MSVLDDIRAKYAKTETVVDSYNRTIVARRLDTAQRLAVREMARTGDPEVVGTMVLGASVVSIDDVPYTFPKSRPELDAVIRALDDPGLEAIASAYEKLAGISEKTVADAKNSAGTPD